MQTLLLGTAQWGLDYGATNADGRIAGSALAALIATATECGITYLDTAAAYGSLASSNFFDRATALYGDRIFAFNHFSLSRTPEENARMLLEGLPDKTFQFDVITHSRGGLVLRNLGVEIRPALTESW